MRTHAELIFPALMGGLEPNELYTIDDLIERAGLQGLMPNLQDAVGEAMGQALGDFLFMVMHHHRFPIDGDAVSEHPATWYLPAWYGQRWRETADERAWPVVTRGVAC